MGDVLFSSLDTGERMQKTRGSTATAHVKVVCYCGDIRFQNNPNYEKNEHRIKTEKRERGKGRGRNNLIEGKA